MLCQLKRISSVSDATANLIETFLSDENGKKTHSPQKSSKRSTLLTPPDEQQLEEDEDEGDSLAENDTGIRDLVAAELTNEHSKSDPPAGGEERRWMKTSLIAASHNLDILVVAAVQKFVILQRVYTNQKQFELTAQVTLQLAEATEPIYITSILPLCIASNRPTNSTNIDWTCVCVGLSDGTIHFYTERGIWVFVEKCANEPIIALRLGPSIYPSQQELIALTGGNRLIVFEGQALYVGLRNARNKIALGEKTVHELSNTYALACHCVELDRGRGGARDFVDVGIMRVSSFDQYVNASCSAAGRDASPTRSILPIYTSYFCAHKDRFGTFEWHSGELLVSELIGDMFTDLTSQVIGVLPSLGFRSMLGIGTSRCDRPAKNCAIDARRYRSNERSCLYDRGRTADRCYMSPAGWGLLAVADSCARVLLIDIEKRCIVRIWKGYRNARCAWIESAATGETIDKRGVRTTFATSRTLFLVIFAPKRALLEVWSMQNGPRVAAFNVHEKGRLLAIDAAERASLLGPTPTSIFGYSHNYTTAAFIFPDGSIFDIRVPFHLSALDASVSSLYDDNYLKSFQIGALLQSDSPDQNTKVNDDGMRALYVERCVTQCAQLNSAAARRRFVELIADYVEQALGGKCCGNAGEVEATNRKSPSVSLSDFSDFIDKLHDVLMDGKTVYDDPFVGHLAAYRLFLRLATAVRSMNADASNVAPIDVDYPQLQTHIDLRNMELETFRPGPPDGPSHCRALTLKSFMGQFEFSCSNKSATRNKSSANLHALALIHDVDNVGFGATVFGPFICGSAEPSRFVSEILPLLDVPMSQIFEIYANFWLDASWNVDPQRWFTKGIEMMSALVECCDLKAYKAVIDVIKNIVFKSTNMQGALLLCVQLRVARVRRLDRQRATNATVDVSPRRSYDVTSPFMTEDVNPTNDESFDYIDDDDLLYNFYYEDDHNEDGTSASVTSETAAAQRMLKGPLGTTRTQLFDLFVEQLRNLALFECLPWTDLYGGENATVAPDIAKKKTTSLEKLVMRREGFYRELFGLWAVAHRPFPYELLRLWNNADDENSQPYDLSERTQMLIKKIINYLPNTLHWTMSFCDCCWEFVCAWSRAESRSVMRLSSVVVYLSVLKKVDRLRHGLIVQMWHTHLMTSFRNLYKILNEKGSSGQSRDRVLKRDVLTTENDLPEYAECIRDIFWQLAEASSNLCSSNPDSFPSTGCAYDPSINAFFNHSDIRKLVLKTDPVSRISDPIVTWTKKGFSQFDKPVTLCDIIRRAPSVNYELVCHHKHLASILSLTIMYGIKICPDTLFDTVGQVAFFQPLDSHPLFRLADVDESIIANRQIFFEKVVEHSEANGICKGQKRYETTWRLINEMAAEWKLNAQNIRIKQIAVLYQNGFDQEAQNLTSKIKDRQQLLAVLTPILLGRIKHFMEDERDLYMKFFQWASFESKWIDRLIKENYEQFMPKFPDVTPDGLKRLMTHMSTFARKPGGVAYLTEDKDNKRTFLTDQQIRQIKEYNLAVDVVVRFFNEKESKA